MTKKYLDIRVTALSDEDLNDFLILLRKINECGIQGMNRTIEVQVDGDGSGQYDFNIDGISINDMILLDPEETQNVIDGKENFKSYLGE